MCKERNINLVYTYDGVVYPLVIPILLGFHFQAAVAVTGRVYIRRPLFDLAGALLFDLAGCELTLGF
jgi:hypothetical protein